MTKTGQNRSSAVMQQRSEPHDSLDDFPTPPWAARAFCEHVLSRTGPMSNLTVWEPACNRGYMVKGLAEYVGSVTGTDIHDYGGLCQKGTFDFLYGEPQYKADWVITNPPFRLAEEFFWQGLKAANKGVALLVRTSFLEGVGRYFRLFSTRPPSCIAQYVERVPMVKGRYDPKASTATSYAWLVWQWDAPIDMQFMWIPPCRNRLERPDD